MNTELDKEICHYVLYEGHSLRQAANKFNLSYERVNIRVAMTLKKAWNCNPHGKSYLDWYWEHA